MMRAAAVPRTEITIGRGTVAVRQDELDKLLKALAALTQEGAASIADEIGALRVAGVRIHLLPTEAEVKALRDAIIAAEPISRSPGSSLARLKALLDEA
jgi:uncharacterized protein YggE